MTPKLTAHGQGAGCQLRRNGRKRRAGHHLRVVRSVSLGVMRSGIVNMQIVLLVWEIQMRSVAIRLGLALMVRWTWRVTYGDGWQIGMMGITILPTRWMVGQPTPWDLLLGGIGCYGAVPGTPLVVGTSVLGNASRGMVLTAKLVSVALKILERSSQW